MMRPFAIPEMMISVKYMLWNAVYLPQKNQINAITVTICVWPHRQPMVEGTRAAVMLSGGEVLVICHVISIVCGACASQTMEIAWKITRSSLVLVAGLISETRLKQSTIVCSV